MLTYKKAGVDINKKELLINKLKKIFPNIGSFAGVYNLTNKYKKPVIVASCDGVGTKLMLTSITGMYEVVGWDVVAMNVNDIITLGAKPTFFMDYFATSKLVSDVYLNVIKGINNGCRVSGCVLIGGETAEMPGFFKKNEFELVGFAIGFCEEDSLIDSKKITPGDFIIGLPSSGIHANGFSLIRKVFSKKELIKYSDLLMKPTRIYVKEILKLIDAGLNLKGIAHITGGGLIRNIKRILPNSCKAVIFKNLLKIPEIFHIIQKKGMIDANEMFNVFNMGIGMVVVCDSATTEKLLKLIKDSIVIGKVEKGNKEVELYNG